MSAASPAAATAGGLAGRNREARLGPVPALFRRAFRDARVRTIAFAYLFAIYAYIQPVGYRHTYTTPAERLSFAHSFGANPALRLFYGEPHGITTVTGYTAWRVGGTLAIVAAVFGLLAAVRALRSDEEAGRMDMVLSGAAGRRSAFLAVLIAIGAGAALLWAAELAGFLVGGLSAAGSAYLALATVSVIPVCVGVGAIASQLAPTRRMALELGGAVLAVMFLLRVIADTAGGVGWLRWATPLGWAEELRPFAGPRPLVLLLPAVSSTALLAIAGWIHSRRDIGAGLLPERDTREPRMWLLSSSTAHAVRRELTGLAIRAGGLGVFAVILGVVSKSITSAVLPRGVRQELAKIGSLSIASPVGYLAFVFIFFVLALSLFGCAQIGAARHEEADGQLETLLAQPLGRVRWICGRLALAAAAIAVLALVAGLLTWAGATSAGVNVSLWQLLGAGANCIPVAILFLGFAALAYATVPRASAGISYGLVTVAFLWQLVGSLLGVPRWLVGLTPFAHVGFVPAQPFRLDAALVMMAIGAVTIGLAIIRFRRRDLTGA